MKKNETLPSGYNWRVTHYSDDEGQVIIVTLVASRYRTGGFMDKLFGREVLSAADEADLYITDDEFTAKVEQLKASLFSHFFR